MLSGSIAHIPHGQISKLRPQPQSVGIALISRYVARILIAAGHRDMQCTGCQKRREWLVAQWRKLQRMERERRERTKRGSAKGQEAPADQAEDMGTRPTLRQVQDAD